MTGPSASVLVNNFNYGRFVADALDSALEQDLPGGEVEVIVVDDGSTDDSAAVLSRFGTRVQVIAKPNGGQASAFNVGFAASSGDLVLLLDADDRFRPGKVAAVAAALAAHPEAGWCFHPLAYVDADLVPSGAVSDAGASGPLDLRDALAAGNATGYLAPATSALAFRRDLLARILPMPEELRITADNYLKAAAMSLAPGLHLDEPLAEQRLHGANAFTLADADRAKRASVELDLCRCLAREQPHLRRYAVRRAMGALRLPEVRAGEPAALEAARRFVDGCTRPERWRLRSHQAAWRLRGR